MAAWWARAGEALARVRSSIDARDSWVPERIRGRVGPSAFVLGLVATCAVAAVVGIKVAGSLADAPSKAVSRVDVDEPPIASKMKDFAANAAAASAAEAVSPKPANRAEDEGTLLLNSANAFASDGRDVEAVALVERAVLRNPELRTDERVAKVLLRTVYSEDKNAVSTSFALMEGPMLERGAELMYELSLASSVQEAPRRRAQSYLRSKEFTKTASLPLFILVKLRQAKTCEDKRALLGLANGGGRQTLEYLRELEAHTTCSPDDLVNCYPCLRVDSRLTDTIATLSKRVEG
ncbi:MAG: hypothetical protein QM756_15865 [Polyangiaceae bacterium]